MFSNSHTGANGDTANFSDVNKHPNLVDHEANPATVSSASEPRVAGLFSSGTAPTTGSGLASDLSGANWREPQHRGAAGDFDEWNPRGEFGSGGANTPGVSLTERISGTVEEFVGKVTGDADKVDSGEQRRVGST